MIIRLKFADAIFLTRSQIRLHLRQGEQQRAILFDFFVRRLGKPFPREKDVMYLLLFFATWNDFGRFINQFPNHIASHFSFTPLRLA